MYAALGETAKAEADYAMAASLRPSASPVTVSPQESDNTQ
jgi:hypothetical protein